jgi:excinuclease ABC subunit A
MIVDTVAEKASGMGAKVAMPPRVIVIEHNLDVIKTADWIIDLGPEGGYGGGRIVAQGAPENVANNPASYTGRYLKEVLPQCQGNNDDDAIP